MRKDTPTQRKLERMNAGLAPEDATYEQAVNTGRLRNDPDYSGRWLAHELRMDDFLAD